jgi:hypothetical protein
VSSQHLVRINPREIHHGRGWLGSVTG